ncbi:rhoptry metalloprotease toxolysin TLN1 [Cardiosporidium cionae]|uniref:Rhoptry metalloprotease toxolysin TLN1 n=1 Tax=Cardiosporidium cionae TaxID=476202 RepID=A0ABQ7JAA3_9APIC|nr:rhoptry metalloprotease toxolysin TLN1 [Cardiosporidium cionae]|eukprot:KAF8820927.1 rhoptry metalloprotease toxolysin TLN1 [Cardiosporidium cionae]
MLQFSRGNNSTEGRQILQSIPPSLVVFSQSFTPIAASANSEPSCDLQLPIVAESIERDLSLLKESLYIQKPPLDERKYQYFKLKPSGLLGVAIADGEDSTGAVAVSVGCGYFHDPVKVPGVAHLLEHMIFLGTKRDPRPSRWDTLISSVAGNHNAYTEAEKTVFYFSAPSPVIPVLLEEFKHHLLEPLLSYEQYATEVMAVDLEHEKNKPSQNRVAVELALNLAPECNVAKKFGTGNYETLCTEPQKLDLDMIEQLRQFHSKCYIPKNMVISIKLGKKRHNDGESTPEEDQYNLLEIEEIVQDIFGNEMTLTKEVGESGEATVPDTASASPSKSYSWHPDLSSRIPVGQMGNQYSEKHSDESDRQEKTHSTTNSKQHESLKEIDGANMASSSNKWEKKLSPLSFIQTKNTQEALSNEIMKDLTASHSFVSQQNMSPINSLSMRDMGSQQLIDKQISQNFGLKNQPKMNRRILIRIPQNYGWKQQLTIFWSIPIGREENLFYSEFQILNLIQYWFEYPGESSLLNVLKVDGLVSGLEYFDYITTQYAIVGIFCDLTDAGFLNFEKVIRYVDAYVDKLHETLQGNSNTASESSAYISSFFKEHSRMSKFAWEFHEKQGSVEIAVQCAKNAMDFPHRPDVRTKRAK